MVANKPGQVHPTVYMYGTYSGSSNIGYSTRLCFSRNDIEIGRTFEGRHLFRMLAHTTEARYRVGGHAGAFPSNKEPIVDWYMNLNCSRGVWKVRESPRVSTPTMHELHCTMVTLIRC